MPPPPTDRLEFRPWTQALRPDFAAMATDPRVVRHITDGEPYSEERIDDFVARQVANERDRGFSMWWVGRRDAAQHVGLCGLQPVPDGSHVEIGWWLRPEHQGVGYALEAAAASLRWTWEATDLSWIQAHTVEANEPSWQLMEKLGMERRGLFPAAEVGRPALDIELLVYSARRPS